MDPCFIQVLLYRYGSMEDKFITDINAGLVVNNIAAQYPWETQAEGLAATKTDEFPIVVGLGLSCRALERKLLVAVDAEKNAKQSALLRFGGEYILRDNFLLRAGLNDGTIAAGAVRKRRIRASSSRNTLISRVKCGF